MLDNSKSLEHKLLAFGKLKSALADILETAQPDCVLSTYPVYGHVIQEIYRDHSERPFRFITVVTDSISINSSWYRAPSDWFCVPNEATAEVLRQQGVAGEKIKAFGFPVSPVFAELKAGELAGPQCVPPYKILYIINTGKKKSGKAIDRLLEIPNTHLTITVGRDAELKEKLARRAREHGDRVQIFGWTNQIPRLDADPSSGHHQGGRGHGAGGDCGAMSHDFEPGAARPGGGQRAAGGGGRRGGGGGEKPGGGRMGGEGVCGRRAGLAGLAGESGQNFAAGRFHPGGGTGAGPVRPGRAGKQAAQTI